jgi:hypothetical protein
MKISACLFAFTVLGFAASAQTVAQPMGGKYNRTSVKVKIYDGIPSQCRASIARAISTLNAVGGKFQFSYTAANISTKSLDTPANDDTDLQFEYRTGFSDPGTNAVAERTWPSTTPKVWTDVDIYFSTQKMFYTAASGNSVGDFDCPSAAGTILPTNKYDTESISLHELGHAVGLDHVLTGVCPMRDYMAKGDTRRKLCANEIDAFKKNYP